MVNVDRKKLHEEGEQRMPGECAVPHVISDYVAMSTFVDGVGVGVHLDVFAG